VLATHDATHSITRVQIGAANVIASHCECTFTFQGIKDVMTKTRCLARLNAF
jgi:hypothetical protein